MKKRLTLVFFACVAFLSRSICQDSLYSIDGKVIPVKVIEVEKDLVKYKKFSNLDDPSYSIEKSAILKIRYQNGEQEMYQHEASLPAVRVASGNPTLRGNKTFLDCKNDEIRGLETDFKNQMNLWNYWQIVSKVEDADFILVVETVKKGMGLWSDGARVTAKAIVKTIDGKTIWESKEYTGNSNMYNGFNSLRASMKKLVDDGLRKEYR